MKFGYDMGAPTHWFGAVDCLKLAVQCEDAGFDDIWMGDHFLPWFHTHAHSPQAWVWMTSAAEKTRKIGIGSAATAPMFKYHPAVVAQAFSTMGCIYPGRIKLIVGTGEALNERPFLEEWPKWKTRSEMLVEAVDLIRKYWSSEDYFSYKGKYFKMENIMCYDRSPAKIPIYFSAYGPKAAVMAGEHSDGLVTWGTKFDYTRKEIVPNFEKGAESARRDLKSLVKIAWVDIGFGEQKGLLDKFRRSSASWFIEANYNEPDPRKAEENAYSMTDEQIRKMAIITDNPDDFISVVERNEKEGMNQLIFSDSSVYPEQTIEVMKRIVIPYFRSDQRS